MSGKGQTQKTTATSAPPKAKPKAAPKPPAYTMVVDPNTGAMKRVPIATAKPAPAPAPAQTTVRPVATVQQTTVRPAATVQQTTVRPAITTAAVQQAAPKPLIVANNDEELNFDVPTTLQPKKEEEEDNNSEENNNSENELVFEPTGEVTGEARAKILAEQRAREEAEAKQKAEAEKPKGQPRKPTKAEATMQNATSDVDKMRLFYRYRSKNPVYFQYTAEGNLEVKENNPLKIPAMVIPMRAFGPLRPEELEEVEQKQKEEQDTIEEQYVVKLKELRLVNEAYDPEVPETIAAVVKANEALREISILRNKALYPERWTKELESVDTRHILFNQPYEERKLGYPVYLFKRYCLSRQDVEGHYREHGEAPGMQEGGGLTVVLFITGPDDEKTGMFHPATENEFVYNETKYASPYQAFQVEQYKEVEDDSMVEKLLGTRSAKTIKALVDKEPRNTANPMKLWEDVLEALCTQKKYIGDALKETGSARFHMMDKIIGTPEYAMALANVRTKLKERETDAPNAVDPVKQSVITKEQQQKDKVGAIVNNFRKRNF